MKSTGVSDVCACESSPTTPEDREVPVELIGSKDGVETPPSNSPEKVTARIVLTLAARRGESSSAEFVCFPQEGALWVAGTVKGVLL